MDGPGAPAEPPGPVAPPLAFFGLWPRIADAGSTAAPRLVTPIGIISAGGTGDPARRT